MHKRISCQRQVPNWSVQVNATLTIIKYKYNEKIFQSPNDMHIMQKYYFNSENVCRWLGLYDNIYGCLWAIFYLVIILFKNFQWVEKHTTTV